MKTHSELYSLAKIVNESPAWHFNIPIYQRLYVWSNDQVLTLLNDLVNAYERGEEIFFLGGVLLVEQEDLAVRTFDLIDGQQRFTTLWLLSQVWRRALTPFLTVTDGKSVKPRLQFGIRPEVNAFMGSLLYEPNTYQYSTDEATKRMRNTLELVNAIFEKRGLPKEIDKEDYLKKLTSFVYEKVQFVVTNVPQKTDLNKLFEVINNRGVQLQHHEILKARMLDALPDEERAAYAVLWEACADMDNFIERSLTSITGQPAHEVTHFYENRTLADSQQILNYLKQKLATNNSVNSLKLNDILASHNERPAPSTTENNTASPSWVRSIIGFPLFLQHTLRIWLHENKLEDLPRLLDRELLHLFELYFFTHENKTENVSSFIKLLWTIRVLFDENIIKWADQGEEEVHLVSTISVSESSGNRYMNRSRETDTDRGFSLLQSMLYHSQEITTQYWLTPLLLFIHKNTGKKSSWYFHYLRHLDNQLFGTGSSTSLVERSHTSMNNFWLCNTFAYRDNLTQELGIKFPHYWFYKLEFVLWYLLKDSKDDRWKKFRLTAKNSVEHISPQHQTARDDNRVEAQLHHFGNLALVSRSINSEYSNLPYNEKRQRFNNKNKSTLDSLKMALIYENDYWNDKEALQHQAQMIAYFDQYYFLPIQESLSNV